MSTLKHQRLSNNFRYWYLLKINKQTINLVSLATILTPTTYLIVCLKLDLSPNKRVILGQIRCVYTYGIEI